MAVDPNKHADFFDSVFQVARLVPEGRATSYGAIAKYLGAVRGARMVGWAMNGAHSIPDVPTHRVVNRNGDLSGRMHFATPTEMEELLAEEGITVKENSIVDFKNIFWDPMIELEL